MPNPVLTKFTSPGSAAQRQTQTLPRPTGTLPAGPSREELERMYHQPAFGGPTYPPTGTQPGYGGGGDGGGATPASRYMTLDDVVVRTGAMLGVLLVVGGLSWVLAPNGGAAAPLLLIGLVGGLGLGLYMAFTMKANAVTALLYSAFEGLLLGAISRVFNDRFPGIVIQALTGTIMVAAGMLVVYRTGAIRVTPKLTRIIVGATLGVLGLMIVNLIASIFIDGGLGLRDGGPLAIVFSLLCIGIAAFNLVLDFDMIEQGIRQGAPEKFAWFASFGLMVTLIWLYLEILRLLGYLRE
ncbi:MAG: Bax inhibitor-1/YccA family protein [Actinomycetota bacterium]